jgi:hypothetical protein
MAEGRLERRHRGMENREPRRVVFYRLRITGRAFPLPAQASVRSGLLLPVPLPRRLGTACGLRSAARRLTR